MRRKDEEAKERNARQYNRGTRQLPSLEPGDKLRIQTAKETEWSEPATVVQGCDLPRSYIVRTPNTTLCRNRAHLQRIPVREMQEKPQVQQDPADSVPLPEADPPPAPVISTPGPVRHSSREKVTSTRLKDYELY